MRQKKTQNKKQNKKKKPMLHSHFHMNDLSDILVVMGIQISHYRMRGIVGLSQRGYIEKVLKRFKMLACFPCAMLVQKDGKFFPFYVHKMIEKERVVISA